MREEAPGAHLVLDDVTVCYGKVEAVKHLHLEVRAGEFVSLLGANGAGKTTILKALSGLTRITTGKIWFNGQRIDGERSERIVALGITHVPEGRRVFPYMSVADNLNAGAFTARREDRERNLEIVHRFFPVLQTRRNQQARSLSGGEQQMLAIGRALMARPKLLLLDEPSMGLSPKLVLEISDIIKHINRQGIGILLVEQNSAMALTLAERGYLLQVGTIVAHGDAQTLVRDDLIKKAYLTPVASVPRT
jgi:branched-chain amino acid transport system ATP-binding protein